MSHEQVHTELAPGRPLKAIQMVVSGFLSPIYTLLTIKPLYPIQLYCRWVCITILCGFMAGSFSFAYIFRYYTGPQVGLKLKRSTLQKQGRPEHSFCYTYILPPKFVMAWSSGRVPLPPSTYGPAIQCNTLILFSYFFVCFSLEKNITKLEHT